MPYIPQPEPDVVSTQVPDGEMILLHLGTRQYFSLNQTATLLWKLMESSTTLAGMSQALSDRFEVSPEMADETVRELMRDLQTHYLITLPESRP
jgi:hypothetical protein